MQQSFITSINFIIKMNVWLVRASQFLRQFYLIVCYKLKKKHIILDAMNRLASANCLSHNLEYIKLDALFVYYTTLVQINSDLVKRILNGYKFNKWWSKICKQVFDNKKLEVDKALLLFVLADAQLSNSDLYFQPKTKPLDNMALKFDLISPWGAIRCFRAQH